MLCVTILSGSKSNSSSIASLGALAAIAFRIAPVMNRLTSALQSMNKNTHSVILLLSELKKLEKPASKNLNKPLDFNNSIRLKDVFYRYPGSNTYALKNINIEIKKDEFIGIVGLSGAGKNNTYRHHSRSTKADGG